MTDDLLKRSGDALRNETAAPELRSGLTRARLLDSAAQQKRKRGNPLRWLVPFVLTLGAGTALAHFTHEYYPEVWNAMVPAALERNVAEDEVVRRAPRTKKKAAPIELAAPAPVEPAVPAVETPVAVEPAPAVATVEPAPERPHVQRKQPPAIARPRAESEDEKPVVPVKPAAPQPAPAESAELALFRRAMKLHTAKDPGAIAAWDDFLRVAPKSPLATEARYNRALGLVRAGRSDAARKALAPFARGEMSGYRQREAAELIDALNDRDAGVGAR